MAVDDLTEIQNRHQYWLGRLSAMQTKLRRVEDQRDAMEESTNLLRADVDKLTKSIEKNKQALKEVSAYGKAQRELYERDKKELEDQEMLFKEEESKSKQLHSELEENTKQFLKYNSLMESHDPKDTYIKDLIEESNNFYLRRFQVLSEGYFHRRVREVQESLEKLRERADELNEAIRQTVAEKMRLKEEAEKRIQKGKIKTELDREVNRLEMEMYSELKQVEESREKLLVECVTFMEEQAVAARLAEESEIETGRGEDTAVADNSESGTADAKVKDAEK